MPGLFISSKDVDVDDNGICSSKMIFEKKILNNYCFERDTLDKFIDDKCFYSDEDYCIGLDGVIFNKLHLFRHYSCDNIAALCKKMYVKKGEVFFKEFRGIFAGFIYDIKSQIIIAFTNQTGTKPLFYFSSGNDFFIGSEAKWVFDACRYCGYSISFNDMAAYQMLTYGFMIDNSTYADQIKRLQAGQYIRIEKGEVSVGKYHKFCKTYKYSELSDDELVEIVDDSFKSAIELGYRKDEEYGLHHFSELSGGLDSRMTMWVPHTIIDECHIQLIEFGKSGYLDEIIAKQVAKYWNDEILIKPLDDLSCLFDIEKRVRMLGGLSLYAGSSGLYHLIDSLNMNKFGIEHTGDDGDVILGSFAKFDGYGNIAYPTGAYSHRLFDIVRDIVREEEKKYGDTELFLLHTRGFQGAQNCHQICQYYTEAYSAFSDIDFFQLCMDIPESKRISHKLYKKWILHKYPEAALFKWERIDDRISESKLRIEIWRLRQKIEKKLKVGKGNPENNMNPFDIWVINNTKPIKYMDQYLNSNLGYLRELTNDEMIRNLLFVYNTGSVKEKMMALTVVASAKIFFGE